MNFNNDILKDVFAIILLLPSLQKEVLVLKDYQYTEENIRKVEFELFNTIHNNTVNLKKDKKRRKRTISCKIQDSSE